MKNSTLFIITIALLFSSQAFAKRADLIFLQDEYQTPKTSFHLKINHKNKISGKVHIKRHHKNKVFKIKYGYLNPTTGEVVIKAKNKRGKEYKFTGYMTKNGLVGQNKFKRHQAAVAANIIRGNPNKFLGKKTHRREHRHNSHSQFSRHDRNHHSRHFDNYTYNQNTRKHRHVHSNPEDAFIHTLRIF